MQLEFIPYPEDDFEESGVFLVPASECEEYLRARHSIQSDRALLDWIIDVQKQQPELARIPD